MSLEFSFIVTGMEEGTATETSVFGSRPRFLMAYEGHHFDRNWFVINTSDWPITDPRWTDMGIKIPAGSDELLKKMGLHPIGMPPRMVRKRTRTWAEWSHNLRDKDGKIIGTTEKRMLEVRKEETRYYPLKQFPYAYRMEDVETELGIRVDIDFTVSIVGVNPWISLILNDDWYLKKEGLVRARARSYVGGSHFFELLSDDNKVRGKLQQFHPLLRQIEKARREEDAERKKVDATFVPTVPEVLEPFNQYIPKLKARGVKGRFGIPPENEQIEDVDLREAIGAIIIDATLESVSLSAGQEDLESELDEILKQDLTNEKRRREAGASIKIETDLAEGKAKAYERETQAFVDRRDKIDAWYSGDPRRAAIRIAALNTESMRAIAANNSIRNLAMSGSGAVPTFPLFSEDESGDKVVGNKDKKPDNSS